MAPEPAQSQVGLTCKIEATGHTLDDVVMAVEEALRRIKDTFTSGFDRNETGSFTFEVDGVEVSPDGT